MVKLTIIVAIAVLLVSLTDQLEPRDDGAVQAVAQTLNDLHDAASKADGPRYFALFAPDVVFLGTDATERWPIEEFRKYAQARFDTGTGWTYTLHDRKRFITLSSGGDVAWFDELLENAKYGTCRGSGVLRKIDGAWKIAQYNLSIPIPNELALDVTKMIREHAKPAGNEQVR
jgi:ketosteroid isomerase-like protein